MADTLPHPDCSDGDPHGRTRLSILSAKARDLARRENRTIAEIVERALEAYEVREAGREPAASFYARLVENGDDEVDLEAVIREGRRIRECSDL